MMMRFWNPTRRSWWPTAARLLSDTAGAAAMEYGLLAALVVVAILGTLRSLGLTMQGLPLPSLVAALAGAAP